MNHIILSLICLFVSIILIDVEVHYSEKYNIDYMSPKIIILVLIGVSVIYFFCSLIAIYQK
jgi:hypothetical protein